jgi:hypothetical protein
MGWRKKQKELFKLSDGFVENDNNVHSDGFDILVLEMLPRKEKQ